MGNPPARAIAARRLNVTPERLGHIRQRYEHTPKSLSTMAADLGCCRQTVCNIAKREGWKRYEAPPRDLTPAARLLMRAERLGSSLHPPLEREGRERNERGGVSDQESSPLPTAVATRPLSTSPLQGEVKKIRQVEGRRVRQRRSPQSKSPTLPKRCMRGRASCSIRSTPAARNSQVSR